MIGAAGAVVLVHRVQRLSDESQVFDVRLGDTVFHAVSESDASQLVEKLRDAINQHTLETLSVAYR